MNDNKLSVIDLFKSAEIDVTKMSAVDRIAMARKVTEYVGAECEKIDKYINKELHVTGCIVHNATVKKEVIRDNEKFEEYEEAKRTVFMTIDKDKKRVPVGAVSMAVEDFATSILIPLFGVGDWVDENGERVVVKIHVGQVTKGDRRTYALQVV